MAARLIDRKVARDLYLSIYDNFALMITDVADERGTQVTVDFINSQFEKVQSEQRIVRDFVNGDYEVWQVIQSYDDTTREEAEAYFDAAWIEGHPLVRPKSHATKPGVVTVTASGVDWTCYCGCGQNRRTRSTLFAPGHDARFASNLIKDARADRITEHEAITRATDVSVKLGRKVSDALLAGRAPVGHANHLTTVPAPSSPADGVVYGTIKVGRAIHPAQLFINPSTNKPHVNINDALDHSGDWLEGEGYNNKPVAYWVKRFAPADTGTV